MTTPDGTPPIGKKKTVQTSLHIDGVNCSACFNETLAALTQLEGVRSVNGSLAGPCIEVDHEDDVLDEVTRTIRDRLHGTEMFSNEIQMVPLEPVVFREPCSHRNVEPTTRSAR